MWFQKAVWCFSFNLPLSPDQIHDQATKDDVTIQQLSLTLSVALQCECVCVCEFVKSSAEVKLDPLFLSVSLSLILLARLGGFSRPCWKLWSGSSSLCVYEIHTNTLRLKMPGIESEKGKGKWMESFYHHKPAEVNNICVLKSCTLQYY